MRNEELPDLAAPGVDRLARGVLTPRQYEALRLAHEGYGSKRIALMLGIDPSSARERVRVGARKLRRELARG